LHALAEQRLTDPSPPAITVVVVENETSGPGEEVCRKHINQSTLTIRYAAEPRPGIPTARNRCLEIAATFSNFVVFIDDDELPEIDWLEQLLRTQRLTAADVVAGPSRPLFLAPPPRWLVRSQLYEPRQPPELTRDRKKRAQVSLLRRLLVALFSPLERRSLLPSGTPIASCSTNNVLFNIDVIRSTGLRFEESMADLGYGEDTLFFERIALANCRIVWCNEAVVNHLIPHERMAASWLIRRELQQGFCSTRIEARLGRVRSRRRVRALLVTLPWALANIIVLPIDLCAGRHRYILRLARTANILGRFVAMFDVSLTYNRRGSCRSASTPIYPAVPN